MNGVEPAKPRVGSAVCRLPALCAMLMYLGSCCLALVAHAAGGLPSFKGDPANTSVSGLSSGAAMAAQYDIAFSASVKGAGIVAGVPYYCAAGNVLNVGICMGSMPAMNANAALLAGSAQSFAAAGKIDSLDHVRAQRIYVFSGTNDRVVKPAAVDVVVAFFRLLGVDAGALEYVNTVPAGHALIVPSYGNECAANAAPFISHCTVDGVAYDQPAAILMQIYGTLNAPANELSGKVSSFDQREFAAKSAAMADEGFVYVPKTCADGAACRLHIAFHGCSQSAKSVGDKFYADGGYNRWADTNGIIVLYPQVNASLLNPQGCWDWWGFTGPGYATKSGPQLAAVKAMADRLLGIH
jgi:poly(3-hydroxybutyrate) depolymerase